MSKPFEFVNAINFTKKNLIKDSDDPAEKEKEYSPYLTNKTLSNFKDTIKEANQMNLLPHMDKRLQFEYLINSIRPRKRFSKWFKKEKNDDLEAVKEFYGFSEKHAITALKVLSDFQIKMIKEKLRKGGKS